MRFEEPMKEPAQGSLGAQLDELVAHLIERIDLLASNVSRNNAKIEELHARLAGCIGVLVVLGAVLAATLARILW